MLIQFTEITDKTITFQQKLPKSDDWEVCKVKINQEPSPSYYSALSAFTSFLIDNYGLGQSWADQSTISGIRLKWTYSDKIGEWSCSIAINATYYNGASTASLSTASIPDIDESVKALVEQLQAEAHAYRFEGKRAQLALALCSPIEEAA